MDNTEKTYRGTPAWAKKTPIPICHAGRNGKKAGESVTIYAAPYSRLWSGYAPNSEAMIQAARQRAGE